VVEQPNKDAEGSLPTTGRSSGMKVFRNLYLGSALVYALVILFWGRYDMGRIHREYRQVTERLSNGYAQDLADREVAAGCRQAVGGEEAAGYGDCLRAATSLVPKRAAVITAKLVETRHQVLEKLAIFYLLVALLLIVLPVSLLYVILLALIYLFANIRYKQD